jgi:hypothetical protein
VSGADFRDLVLTHPTVTLRTAAGEEVRVAAAIGLDGSALTLVLLSRLHSRLTNEPVSLHAEFSLKRFRDVATATLPNDGSAVMLDGREQCRAIRPRSTGWEAQPPWPIVMCRHALSAAPWRELRVRPVPDREVNSSMPFFSRVVIPTIDPITDVRMQLWRPIGALSSGPDPTTVVLRERVTFVRASLVAENLRLADYVEP